MKLVATVAIAIAGIAIIGAAGGSSSPATRPGNPAVYARLASMTDCAGLQHEFDLAEATHQRGGSWGPIGTAYMGAADARMRQIGCYR